MIIIIIEEGRKLPIWKLQVQGNCFFVILCNGIVSHWEQDA